MNRFDVPALFEPVMRRVLHDAERWYGRRVELMPVAYDNRPFSHLLRVQVADGEGMPIAHLFVKVFKHKADVDPAAMRQRIVDDFDANHRAYAAMRDQLQVGAVPPVCCYPDLLTIVTEEVQGETLLEHLSRHAVWWPSERRRSRLLSLMTTLAQWMRTYQQVSPPGEPLTSGHFVDYIDHRLKRMTHSPQAGFTEHQRQFVRSHVAGLLENIPADRLRKVPTHFDLALGNVIVSGDRVVALDFGMAGFGAELHDLTRVHVQLDMLRAKPQFRPTTVAALQDQLVRAFGVQSPDKNRLFRLLVLLHRVNHLTKLSLNSGRFPVSLHNRWVVRQHRGWLEREINSPLH